MSSSDQLSLKALSNKSLVSSTGLDDAQLWGMTKVWKHFIHPCQGAIKQLFQGA
jgi:hypothetical protein